MALYKDQVDDPLSRLWLHYFKSMNCFKISLHMSARTKEANIPSSCAKRLSGVSYSKIIPRFITITRSAVRIVWTRCCEWKEYMLFVAYFKTQTEATYMHISSIIQGHLFTLGYQEVQEAQPLKLFLNVSFIYILKILGIKAESCMGCIKSSVVSIVVSSFAWRYK